MATGAGKNKKTGLNILISALPLAKSDTRVSKQFAHGWVEFSKWPDVQGKDAASAGVEEALQFASAGGA